MVWNVIGLALAAAVAIVAWRRSATVCGPRTVQREPRASYDTDVYGMTAATHRRYAMASLGFALYFAVTIAFDERAAGIAGLALYTLVAILYGTSFLRGASDAD